MFRLTRTPSRSILSLLTVTAVMALFAAGCGLLGDDEENGAPSNGGTTSVRVMEAVMSNEVNEEQQATGLVSRVFPPETTQVFAVLTLSGVEPGTDITGRWFQLSVQDAPPGGAEVSAAGVRLNEDNIFEGRARVALNLSGGGNNLPEGDWLVRIYANDVFVRTMAFVITRQAVLLPNGNNSNVQVPQGQNQGQGQGQNQGQSQPQPTVRPQRYVVEAGDSLASIAERFRANETVEAFAARLVAPNNQQPNTGLIVGQEILIPPAP